MISMQGVPSSLILRNQSWVRQQARSMVRHLPANVEVADLIQVGLIGVAQAAVAFSWEGDHDSEEAREAFVRYARSRVKGAMLDELRQMDHLSREQRRMVKVVQVATERWRAQHGREPTKAELSQACGIPADEIFELEMVAHSSGTASLVDESDEQDRQATREASTEADEVEARVDTGILMRRLEKFFASLPESERAVIDSYLGIGMSPSELARSLNVSPSRVSYLFKSICERIGIHMGHAGKRSTDRANNGTKVSLDDLIALRETERTRSGAGSWGRLMEAVLSPPPAPEGALEVTASTRWG